MGSQMLIGVALVTFTVGFLISGAPADLAHALPAVLVVFVVFALSGRLRDFDRDYDLHYLKVAVITVALWIPVAMFFYSQLLMPLADFSCTPDFSAEAHAPAAVAESSPPVYTVTPVGEGDLDGGYRCGDGRGGITESNLTWAGVLNRKARVKPEPFYPLKARAAEISGTVAVLVSVNESGIVTSAKAVSGHASLRRAAADAACYARFAPVRSGPSVGVRGVLIYDF